MDRLFLDAKQQNAILLLTEMSVQVDSSRMMSLMGVWKTHVDDPLQMSNILLQCLLIISGLTLKSRTQTMKLGWNLLK